MLNVKVKILRKQQGLSQRELGDKCGFSQQEISYIERGIRKRFTDEEIKKLAVALSVLPSALIDESEK